jgi:hypothetical protein
VNVHVFRTCDRGDCTKTGLCDFTFVNRYKFINSAPQGLLYIVDNKIVVTEQDITDGILYFKYMDVKRELVMATDGDT